MKPPLPQKQGALITAHRGGRYWSANDFSYITESIEAGANIIELDIRMNSDKEFIVQHDRFAIYQGKLERALKKLQDATVYLDIKESSIDAQKLIDFVRTHTSATVIVGSYSPKVLMRYKKLEVLTNLHTLALKSPISVAKEIGVDWINPVAWRTTKRLAQEIQENGFRFVPAGNFRRNSDESNQVRNAQMGAYCISTYHFARMVKMLKDLKIAQNLC